METVPISQKKSEILPILPFMDSKCTYELSESFSEDRLSAPTGILPAGWAEPWSAQMLLSGKKRIMNRKGGSVCESLQAVPEAQKYRHLKGWIPGLSQIKSDSLCLIYGSLILQIPGFWICFPDPEAWVSKRFPEVPGRL